MSWTMTAVEREAFLADLHVGVLSVAAGERQPPVTAPVWYTYEPGGLVSIITARESVKARLLRAEGQASLCVQTETPPYAYVSVEGQVVEMEDVDADERLALARRYLGREGGDQYIAANRDVDNLTIRIAPQRWRTVDYNKVWGPPAGT
jgi:PPOX class probable F420-dependent enzyme